MEQQTLFWRFAEHPLLQDISARLLLKTDLLPSAEELSWLHAHHCGVLTGNSDVIAACADIGMDVRFLFFRMSGSDDDALRAVHGKCRYLVEEQADLPRLDALAEPLLTGGRLEEIALRVSPAGSFSAENIPTYARALRRAEHLAVRGIFLPLNAAENLSIQAKDAFSLVKKLRSDLPCLFHSFCFEGLLPSLAAGDRQLADTLQMLASLNDTSLYANFYLA